MEPLICVVICAAVGWFAYWLGAVVTERRLRRAWAEDVAQKIAQPKG